MALVANSVTVDFSGLRAVENVTLSLASKQIVGLVGPNGAGKTTLVNVLSGFQPPSQGQVSVNNSAVAGRSAAWMARNGVVRTFQAVRLFSGLTVAENVEAALTSQGLGRRQCRHRALEVLEYLDLSARANHLTETLDYVDERRVGLARALALQPQFLLLDEPAAGMTVAEADSLASLICQIRNDYECGVLLIEHNMALITQSCEWVHAMASGRTVCEGVPEDVFSNAYFRQAYLGEGASQALGQSL